MPPLIGFDFNMLCQSPWWHTTEHSSGLIFTSSPKNVLVMMFPVGRTLIGLPWWAPGCYWRDNCLPLAPFLFGGPCMDFLFIANRTLKRQRMDLANAGWKYPTFIHWDNRNGENLVLLILDSSGWGLVLAAHFGTVNWETDTPRRLLGCLAPVVAWLPGTPSLSARTGAKAKNKSRRRELRSYQSAVLTKCE